MALQWEFARDDLEGSELASFSCWDNDPSTPWIEEVENYVRGWLLKDVPHVVVFRDETGQLVAVAGFDKRTIAVPVAEPADQPGWTLTVLAVALERQRSGLSRQIFEGVFKAMRKIDRGRVLYTAKVHRENRASVRACAAVDLFEFRRDGDYIELLGEVPPD